MIRSSALPLNRRSPPCPPTLPASRRTCSSSTVGPRAPKRWWRGIYAPCTSLLPPYAGVESAQAWVEEAREEGFAEVYAENIFLVFATTLGRYSAETRSAYI